MYPLLITILPGPDRKRAESLYQYRVTYRNPEPDAPGCVLTWEVRGGRLTYQIALESDDAGRLRWHCDCADAVYRAEEEGRLCKHVLGLLEFGWVPKGPLPENLRQRTERCA